MTKRTNLRLVISPTTVPVSPHPAGDRDGGYLAGALRSGPPGRDRERIVELEGALIRIAGLCSDRPAVMALIGGVLFDNPGSAGDGPT